MKGTIYEDDYHHEHLQNVVDNLNLLYVAFTRARSGLFVIGKRGAKNSRSEIIEQTLPSLTIGTITGIDDKDSAITFEYGTLSYIPDSKKADTDNPFLQPSEPFHVSMITHATKSEFRQSNQSRDFINGDDEQNDGNSYIQMGSILHRIFSTIHTTSTALPFRR
jgi:ATP-dependent exoDNAse (exonuclease V) beta subunit